MKRIAIAVLMLWCAAGCSERSQRPQPRSFTHCPIVIRLTASGDLSASDCRVQKKETFSTLADGLRTLLGSEEWDERPPPILVDIDDATPLSMSHEVFIRVQDASQYSVGLADGSGREPIMIALPPPSDAPEAMRPIEPGAPYAQRGPIDPATNSRIVIVRIRTDHLLEVTEYPFMFTKNGSRATSPVRAAVTTSAAALPALLASYPKGRYVLYRGQADTPWSEVKDVLRTLAQARRDQIVLEETPY